MEFREKRPTEDGVYHGRLPNSPNECRVLIFKRGQVRAYNLRGDLLGDTLCVYEWGDRIDPPKPVPEEVTYSSQWLGEWVRCGTPSDRLAEAAKNVKTILNYIDPPKPKPKLPLPLPRRFRGTAYQGQTVDGIEMPNGKRIWACSISGSGCGYDYPDWRSADLVITEWIDEEPTNA